jgi:hypothetical protein
MWYGAHMSLRMSPEAAEAWEDIRRKDNSHTAFLFVELRRVLQSLEEDHRQPWLRKYKMVSEQLDHIPYYVVIHTPAHQTDCALVWHELDRDSCRVVAIVTDYVR